MAPRRDVAAIDADSSMDEVLAITGEHPHRRYPVYESDLDHVIGLLDTKDLMRVVRKGGRTGAPLSVRWSRFPSR